MRAENWEVGHQKIRDQSICFYLSHNRNASTCSPGSPKYHIDCQRKPITTYPYSCTNKHPHGQVCEVSIHISVPSASPMPRSVKGRKRPLGGKSKRIKRSWFRIADANLTHKQKAKNPERNACLMRKKSGQAERRVY
jgi:hypothetical protein